MNKREKAARMVLKSMGHQVTKKGDGRSVDALDAETYKHGIVSRLLGNPPKRKN